MTAVSDFLTMWLLLQKITNLENLRHSESASDLQQNLYLMCKVKTGILGIEITNLFYYVIVNFMLFHISFSLSTLISISFSHSYDYVHILIKQFLCLFNVK